MTCQTVHERDLRRETPCFRCPKYLLFPGANYGLHPANGLAVQLYYQAARDQRVGMDGCLIGTMTAADARAVIDLYGEHLPTPRSRQEAFEKMNLLDEIATTKRSDRESREREAERLRSERKAKR